MKGLTSTQIVATVFIVAAAGVFGAVQMDFLSLTDVQAEDTYSFVTNPGQNCFYDDGISNGMDLYGKTLTVENHEVETVAEGEATPANPDQAIATVKYGDQEEHIYSEDETVNFEYIQVSIRELEAQTVSTGISCGGFSYGSDYINNIIWEADITIPDDMITADFSDVNVEDVGEGEKKVEANVTVNNDLGPIQVEKLRAEVLGNEVDLDTGVIEEGSTEYEIVSSESFYDSSRFIYNEEVDGEVQLVFEDPRVPEDMVSGKPDRNGDFGSFEAFQDGGTEIDGGTAREIKDEGTGRYTSIGDCDIESMRLYGLDENDCTYYSGGETSPANSWNWGLSFEDFRSVTSNFSTTVSYCGENATYRDGECVIDEDLHLRGDLCLLLDNYTMVTEEFGSGTYSEEDLQYSPDYFCSKHPVVVADEGVETGTTIEPYQSLVDGGSFTVPAGSTYQFSYAVNAQDAGVDVVCGEDTVLNESTGECTVDPGFTHVCSGDSVWNPDTGSCTTHTEVEPVCNDPDARYDSNVDRCVSEAGPSGCPVGSVAGPEGDVCYSEASVERVCPDNVVDGRVTDTSCVSDADVVLRQRNLLGDWVNALQNTWNALIELVGL